MQSREKIAARLRRHHFEWEDDIGPMLDGSQIDNNFHPREIALLVSFNQAVKRLNQCYTHPKPNAAHIDSALRHAKQLHDDISKHRVAYFMPQGVETIQRRPGGDGDFPVDGTSPPLTGLNDFPGRRRTGLDDLRPSGKNYPARLLEIEEVARKGRSY